MRIADYNTRTMLHLTGGCVVELEPRKGDITTCSNKALYLVDGWAMCATHARMADPDGSRREKIHAD